MEANTKTKDKKLSTEDIVFAHNFNISWTPKRLQPGKIGKSVPTPNSNSDFMKSLGVMTLTWKFHPRLFSKTKYDKK